jgi:superfamily II DNA or RNA helicase
VPGDVVTARVASEIEIKVDDLDQTLLEQIKSALEIPNEDKEKQAALQIWGHWDLPDTISLWRIEARRSGDKVICLPRGFSSQLAAGMANAGVQIKWEDHRSTAHAAPGYFVPFLLRDYQLKAVLAMLNAQQGIYRAPAAAGKTVACLGLMTHAQQRAIVIVDKSFLLEQWRERAAQFLGLSLDLDDERSVGKIGEDIWEERDLTICLRQTLSARLWETKATGFFNRVGVTILDEVHHVGSAETLQEIIRTIPSKIFLGPSATPARTEMQGKIINALIGPIVAETTRQELYDRKILVRPSLQVVDTEFEAAFWKTHESKPDGTCDDPSCTKSYQHGHRDNYQSVLKKLVEDKERNRLIAQKIISERGHVHLVPSRQLKHLNLLKKALEDEGWDGPIYLLRGEENAQGDSQKIVKAIEAGGHWVSPAKARKLTKKAIEKLRLQAEEEGVEFIDPNERAWEQIAPIGEHGHEAVILSTVADEGMDVPMIDREHIVFPIRQEAAVIQLIGRCERVSPLKKDAKVYDYRDLRCIIFADQAHDRLRVYRYQSLREETMVT